MSYEHGVNNPFTAEEIEVCLHALVSWAGNSAQTSRYLKAEKDLDISPVTLNNWKRKYGPRYDEIREKFGAAMEENLAHEMRDGARLAIEAQKLAVARAHEALESGTEKDPARAAANLARVAQSNTDKLQSLTGRPSRITENRSVEELLRSLISMKVLVPPEQPAIEEAVPEDPESMEA